MEPTALALTGYISWILILVCGITIQRTYLTLTGKHEANAFKPDGSNVSDFTVRFCRAHANCYESFPIIGGLLILAMVTDLTQITNPLALVVLIGRIAQSVTHLISTKVFAVQLRFLFFLVQLIICFYWLIQFVVVFAGI